MSPLEISCVPLVIFNCALAAATDRRQSKERVKIFFIIVCYLSDYLSVKKLRLLNRLLNDLQHALRGIVGNHDDRHIIGHPVGIQ